MEAVEIALADAISGAWLGFCGGAGGAAGDEGGGFAMRDVWIRRRGALARKEWVLPEIGRAHV